MRRNLGLFIALFAMLAASGFWAQEKEKTQEVTPTSPPKARAHVFTVKEEDKARKNPMHFSELSVARGAKMYKTQCSMCHGEKGDGKGELAVEMQANPPDFTKLETLKNRTDGELYAIIRQGSEVMPSQEKRMKERHLWDIVNYLRVLSGKTPEKPTEEDLHEGTIIPPETKP